MWTVSRRTGLFVLSYFPLAAMFIVLKWPDGWDARQLVRLGIRTLAAAALLMLPPVLVTVTGRLARTVVLLALAFALVLVIIAASSARGCMW